ncbi:MAG: CpXC domain-containing protein [Clostridia bacterium]|nr:CpXC domain-containing protein [Clostridia bacterium]
MSKKIEIEIKCPYCHIQNKGERWDFIDTRSNPELKTAVRSGEAFIYKCPSCDTPYDVDAPFAYFEPEKKFFLMYTNNKEDYEEALRVLKGEEESMLSEVRAVLDEILTDETYAKRLVFGRDELFEKLTLLDHGLDDGIMELLKIAYGQKIASRRNGDVAAAVTGKGTTTYAQSGTGKKTPEFDYLRFFLDDETKIGCLYLMKDNKRIAKLNTSRVVYNQVLERYGAEVHEREKNQVEINFRWAFDLLQADREKQMAAWE